MDRLGAGAFLVVLLVLGAGLPAGTAAAAEHPDPETDVIGWENGYWYNDSIDVDQTDEDGLSDAERAAYVNRTAARIEVLRGEEFNASVPVTVVDRAEYGNQTVGNASDDYRAWNNQVWEALFVVGEDQDVEEVLHSTATSATSGAYVYPSGEIRIITDAPDRPTINRLTLAHELVHALQDQHHNLSNDTYRGDTQDEQLAVRGLIEGEANYLEAQYRARCGEEWECVASPLSIDGGGGGGGDSNPGVLVTLFQPYSDGPPYVHSIVEAEGWDGIDAAFERPPSSTEQTIHRTGEAPAPLTVEDEARAGWRPFTDQGVNGTDTAGEASMFAMLWYQAVEYRADTVDPSVIQATDAEYDTYNYAVEATAGWGNDGIMPYQRGTATGPEYGYVWVTTWDTRADARQFEEAYTEILAAHEADSVGPRTWVIDSGPFADAFRVVSEGRRVTIVNAPEADDLDALRPSLEPTPTPTATTPTTSTRTPTAASPSPMEPADTPNDDGSLTEAPPQPGFGLAVGTVGAVAFGGWLWARRRL